ncbi:class I SAM-dependent methyltransferase [Fulvivirga maritima]|uniref:class I SAM-dependent methyltransferase n=1 Tax=Fulvivirga maritima TaxID=2904247 RepID=UPI001F2EDD15|nr:class I SAM-dependent methyltransferase [Fulvivirga maritima]UII25822.1 class I SAM-dependent methyltransferase [Fulvivirga maritima]
MHNQGLMSGMGELWSSINKSSIDVIEINAVDISPKMTSIAKGNLSRTNGKINLLQQDVLNNSISSNTADIVVSSFGLKTFNLEQLTKLAKEISRILKPGASFSFVEISVPPNPFLRLFYMFYLKVIIPIIGFLFQGNSGDYRMLGIYTSKFNNCKNFQRELTQAGLEANYQALFFGCATVTWGKKSGKVTEPISS